MQYINIVGTWQNEFDSIMTIEQVDMNTGIFSGTYQSDTGATGKYYVTGFTDTKPDPSVNSQVISFSILWRSFTGGNNETQYWASGFVGQIQLDPHGTPVMTTTYLLQKNTNPADNWGSTVVAPSTFRQKVTAQFKHELKVPEITTSTDGTIHFPLRKGKLSDNGATPWVAQIGIGTPAQALSVMIDTGTDNTWITSDACTTKACQAHGRFDADKSGSYQLIDGTVTEKSFGPWGTMKVIVGADIWQFEGGATSEAMNFELSVYYEGRQFLNLDADGGIAIPGPYWHTSDQNTESLLIQLLKDGKLNYGIASFWTDPQSGEGGCLFGGVDPTRYNPRTLQWIRLQNDYESELNYLWQIPLESLTFDGQSTSANITAFVLDTGSSYFKGPADLINTLRNEATRGGTLPCFVTDASQLSQYPMMTLTIGAQTYTLSPQQYFIQTGVSFWELGIQVLDGMPEGMLLVGSVFLDTVYSIFNLQDKCIGLADRVG